ncbi:DUF211 domain-containing protein [Sedimenticola selenatireducens]|uniref:DUF211 domain-containing protein n=1 Tax=Sedimenticola selenatireducens TaxID=191960 RepID=A0A2N6CVF0_9GAMM|nr:DUF211 domain-containing protein [Sedimenticola selenatireducens]PLX61171.1 MAG: hypothetical protein C0630_12300 [Sedimenticola selenatireducens]
MIRITHLLLDVLKPLHPNVIEFSKALARMGNYQIRLSVVEMDSKTETLQIEIEGSNIDYEQIQAAISEMGASLHSIDAVVVENDPTELD